MSYAQRLAVTVTTDASGDATEYVEGFTYGKLSQIRYVKTDFDDGATFAITTETSSETLWSETGVNASATRAPRQVTHATDGELVLFTTAGESVRDKIAIANERIKIVVSGGGNVKTGAFHFTLT